MKAANRAIAELEAARLIVVTPGSFTGPKDKRPARYKIAANVCEPTTLPNGERSRIDRVNVSDSTQGTLAIRVQNEIKRKDQGKRSSLPLDAASSIYALYPRKVAKDAALKAIDKALKAIAARNGVADPAAWLLERVKMFASSPAGQAGRFTPHPATWFNGGRYDDDLAEWQRGNGDAATPARLPAPAGKYDRFRAQPTGDY